MDTTNEYLNAFVGWQVVIFWLQWYAR